ncbi:uncharacterized protein LOC141901082 isoform X2 [Tubulanus polymorphus]|uniref:uncharacterized protein LOC141901082 isoform X2 n=1 Tax=Tubulanus polymorphus TaxID=672921 RepID=UPI003DA671E6
MSGFRTCVLLVLIHCYACTATEVNALPETHATAPPPSQTTDKMALIVGIVTGLVVIFIIIGVTIYIGRRGLITCREKKNVNNSQRYDPDDNADLDRRNDSIDDDPENPTKTNSSRIQNTLAETTEEGDEDPYAISGDPDLIQTYVGTSTLSAEPAPPIYASVDKKKKGDTNVLPKSTLNEKDFGHFDHYQLELDPLDGESESPYYEVNDDDLMEIRKLTDNRDSAVRNPDSGLINEAFDSKGETADDYLLSNGNRVVIENELYAKIGQLNDRNCSTHAANEDQCAISGNQDLIETHAGSPALSAESAPPIYAQVDMKKKVDKNELPNLGRENTLNDTDFDHFDHYQLELDPLDQESESPYYEVNDDDLMEIARKTENQDSTVRKPDSGQINAAFDSKDESDYFSPSNGNRVVIDNYLYVTSGQLNYDYYTTHTANEDQCTISGDPELMETHVGSATLSTEPAPTIYALVDKKKKGDKNESPNLGRENTLNDTDFDHYQLEVDRLEQESESPYYEVNDDDLMEIAKQTATRDSAVRGLFNEALDSKDGSGDISLSNANRVVIENDLYVTSGQINDRKICA